jgi:hypothetical protein
MKKNILVLTALLGLSLQASATCPDFSGKWKCTYTNQPGAVVIEDVTVNDTEYTFVTDANGTNVSNFDGEKHDMSQQGNPNVYYSGTCAGNKINLQISGQFEDDNKIVDITAKGVATLVNPKYRISSLSAKYSTAGKPVHAETVIGKCTKLTE